MCDALVVVVAMIITTRLAAVVVVFAVQYLRLMGVSVITLIRALVLSTIAAIMSWSCGDGWLPLATIGWLRLPRCSSPCTPSPQTCICK